MSDTSRTNNGEQPSFPQFASLPTELRLRVWHFFCERLKDGPRVFRISLATDVSQIMGDEPYRIQPTDTLKHQTALARAALSVNSESRGEALKYLPDTFAVNDGTGLVRFTAKDDIVLLDGEFNAPWMRASFDHHIEGFSDHIVNLALGTDFVHFRAMYLGRNIDDMVHTTWFLLLFLKPFTRLEHIYYCWDDRRVDPYHKPWCASDLIQHYHFLPDQVSVSGNEPEQAMYCWLDPKHEWSPECSAMEEMLFTNEEGPSTEEVQKKIQLLLRPSHWSQEMKTRIHRIIEPLNEGDLWRLSEIDMRKMIIFRSSDGLRRFNALNPSSKTPI